MTYEAVTIVPPHLAKKIISGRMIDSWAIRTNEGKDLKATEVSHRALKEATKKNCSVPDQCPHHDAV